MRMFECAGVPVHACVCLQMYTIKVWSPPPSGLGVGKEAGPPSFFPGKGIRGQPGPWTRAGGLGLLLGMDPLPRREQPQAILRRWSRGGSLWFITGLEVGRTQLWGGEYNSSETCSWAQRLSFFLVKRAGYWRRLLALCLDLLGAEGIQGEPTRRKSVRGWVCLHQPLPFADLSLFQGRKGT